MVPKRKRLRPPKPKARPLCVDVTDAGRPCRWQALEGSDRCYNHAPERADVRRAAGGTRHPLRFHPDQDERREAIAPTFERLADRLIDIADRVQSGALKPERARAATTAVRGAVQALQARRLRTVAVEAHDAQAEPQPAPPDPTLEEELQDDELQ